MTKNKVFYGRKKVSVIKKKKNVLKIFTEVSDNYDKMNDIMSLGTHRLWKKDLVDKISYNLSNKKVSKILDIAGGTGDISISILKKYPNNNITILDLTPEMIKVGKSKAIKKGFIYNPIWIAGDSAELPFKNSIYDPNSKPPSIFFGHFIDQNENYRLHRKHLSDFDGFCLTKCTSVSSTNL